MNERGTFALAGWLAVAVLVTAVVVHEGRGSDSLVRVERFGTVSQLTGPGSPSRTAERWNVYGSDLGFPFEHEGRLHLVFGDTWGEGGVEAGDWRSNAMGIVEPDPEAGLVMTDMITDETGEAKELLGSRKEPGIEYTTLPTGGFSVHGRMHLQYMSVRDWRLMDDEVKHPVVNHAGLAFSDDGGHTWTDVPYMRRPGDGGFVQTTFLRHEGHVYGFGTPAGRFGPVKLMRVPEDAVLDPDAYRYWDGVGWADGPQGAAEIVPPTASELSVEWSPYLDRWVMMYLSDARRGIVLRTAPDLVGPWDEGRVVISGRQHPYLYAPFLLPGQEGPELRFTMSKFDPYQVFVMELELERAG